MDGDKKLTDSFTSPGNVSPTEYAELGNLIKAEVGCEPKLFIPGGDAAAHQDAKTKEQLKYLAWIERRLAYLPVKCPEQALLEGNGVAVDPNQTSEEIKSLLMKLVIGDVALTSEQVHGVLKAYASKVSVDHPILQSVRATLQSWLV